MVEAVLEDVHFSGFADPQRVNAASSVLKIPAGNVAAEIFAWVLDGGNVRFVTVEFRAGTSRLTEKVVKSSAGNVSARLFFLFC